MVVIVLVVLAFIFFALSKQLVCETDYDEDITKYIAWPMASAAYGDHPDLCVKDNFDSAEVSDYYF